MSLAFCIANFVLFMDVDQINLLNTYLEFKALQDEYLSAPQLSRCFIHTGTISSYSFLPVGSKAKTNFLPLVSFCVRPKFCHCLPSGFPAYEQAL